MLTNKKLSDFVQLDLHGRVTLTDAQLDALVSSYEVVTSGGSAPTWNSNCTNAGDCRGSLNSRCSNTLACDGSTNGSGCTRVDDVNS